MQRVRLRRNSRKRQDQPIEFAGLIAAGRDERKEQAFAVKFFEIEGFFAEDRRAAFDFAERDRLIIVHCCRSGCECLEVRGRDMHASHMSSAAR